MSPKPWGPMAHPPTRRPMMPGIRAFDMMAGPASTTTKSTRKLKAAPSGRCRARIIAVSCLGPDQREIIVATRQRSTKPPSREPVDRAIGDERADGGVDCCQILRAIRQCCGESLATRQLRAHVVEVGLRLGQRQADGKAEQHDLRPPRIDGMQRIRPAGHYERTALRAHLVLHN